MTELAEWCAENNYAAARWLDPDRRVAALIFGPTNSQIIAGDLDSVSDRWSYTEVFRALEAWSWWLEHPDEPEPRWWIRHQPTNRRRTYALTPTARSPFEPPPPTDLAVLSEWIAP